MKRVLFLAVLLALLVTTGCESHEHHQMYRGGAYDDSPYYGGYGRGEYRGYPNYSPGPFPDHPFHQGY